MKLFPFAKEFLVFVACCAQTISPAQAQSSCTWPMSVSVKVPNSGDYPAYVWFHFSKQDDGSGFIKIRETTTVQLKKLVNDYPSLVMNSDGWRDLQSRLNCNNRAGDYTYGLNVVDGHLVAGFSANVEKYWCTSTEHPCVGTVFDPVRTCREEANGKLWGARVSSSSTIELQRDGQGAFNAVVINTTTSSNTSNEQNFIRDLIGAPFLGPIGINAIREMESSALNTIKDSMKAGFDHQRFQLNDGTALPDFPNYNPKIVNLMFAHEDFAGVVARMEREDSGKRESTTCSLAKRLGAKTIPTLSPGALRARQARGEGRD